MSILALTLACLTATDRIDVSFGFFGCNRLDKKDFEGTDNVSSANVSQLTQNFRDLAALSRTPEFVFCAGDIVNNYEDDRGETLLRQMNAWSVLAKNSELYRKTTIIPFPGNHELNKKPGDDRMANPPTVDVWSKWYANSGFKQMASNGPRVGEPDQVAADQSTLSYSFDKNGVHFIVLNTDTVTSQKGADGKPQIALVPLKWTLNNLRRAQQNPKIKSIFVLGHRNLVEGSTSKGDAPIDPSQAPTLLAALRTTPKVRAYVCAHVHAFDIAPLGGPSKAMQVILGNGGSKLEKDWKPAEGTFFGFGVIDVYASGRVVLRNFKRPTPAKPLKYFEGTPEPAKPTSVVLYDPTK